MRFSRSEAAAMPQRPSGVSTSGSLSLKKQSRVDRYVGQQAKDAAASGDDSSATTAETPLSLATLLSSLSCALDLTEGQPMGHAVRTCLIGLRIARVLHLPEDEAANLHLALLLKDAGCSSNAARMFALFGCDDITAKGDSKIRDWRRLTEAMRFAMTHTLPGAPLAERLRKMNELTRLPGRVMDILTEARCTRGADIARSCGLGEDAAQIIFHLDEHWDGQGAPYGKKGEEIPLRARIACLAQTMEVFAATFDPGHAYKVARSRSGQWFDPDLVKAAETFAEDADFWEAVQNNPRALLSEWTGPLLQGRLPEADLDTVCAAFAGIIDAKSSFTASHSARVSQIAREMATTLGLSPQRCSTLRRAALLHDVGKLAIPNIILDKPGPLTSGEFDLMKRHPYYTERILVNVPAWNRLTQIAATHHEKLDGSGYFRGLTGDVLDLDMRLLAVADVYDALASARPYREALDRESIDRILRQEVQAERLDAECVAALPDSAGGISAA